MADWLIDLCINVGVEKHKANDGCHPLSKREKRIVEDHGTELGQVNATKVSSDTYTLPL